MLLRCFHILFSITAFSVAAVSCKKDAAGTLPKTEAETHYTSIKKIAYNEFLMNKGQPFILSKIITLNGKQDSILFNSFNADWGAAMEVFFAADITDPKYEGQYERELIDEPSSWSKVISYKAKDPKLFTRSMQVWLDPETRKVKAVYIETEKSNFWNHNSQKLYYAPNKVIMIQESDKPLVGEDKELKIEYHLPAFYNTASQ